MRTTSERGNVATGLAARWRAIAEMPSKNLTKRKKARLTKVCKVPNQRGRNQAHLGEVRSAGSHASTTRSHAEPGESALLLFSDV